MGREGAWTCCRSRGGGQGEGPGSRGEESGPYSQCGIFFFLIDLFFYSFYFWLRWVFVAVPGLALVATSRGYSLLRCTGFSLRWLLLLQSTGSRHVGSVVVALGLSSCGSRALGHRLSSHGSWA